MDIECRLLVSFYCISKVRVASVLTLYRVAPLNTPDSLWLTFRCVNEERGESKRPCFITLLKGQMFCGSYRWALNIKFQITGSYVEVRLKQTNTLCHIARLEINHGQRPTCAFYWIEARVAETKAYLRGGFSPMDLQCENNVPWSFPLSNVDPRHNLWFTPTLVWCRAPVLCQRAIIVALHRYGKDKDPCSLQFPRHPNICLWLIGVTASLISIFVFLPAFP